MLRKEKGFTLIELIIIIVIIGILAAVAIPRYVDLVSDAQNGTARGVLGGLRSANTILFADRLVHWLPTSPTYTILDVVGSAQIQGVAATAIATSTFSFQVGSSTYTFTLNGTTVSVPTTPQTIFAATGTW